MMDDLKKYISIELNEILRRCPSSIDLTNVVHLALIDELVERLSIDSLSDDDILWIENNSIHNIETNLVFLLLALKIFRSKLIIDSIEESVKVSIVFAMYKENNRIKSKKEHPHGEDFLRIKVNQLKSLFCDSPNFEWELIAVDDGCPNGSGIIAEQIIKDDALGDNVKVLFLDEAISKRIPVISSLDSTSDSQKGGAIIYGMWEASQDKSFENHIIVYTDADLSTHLGQIGLLVEPIIKAGKAVGIGSRRETSSVVIKKGSRNDRGKLFIYLWKRMLNELSYIIDTQCGFKAFHRDIVEQILNDLIEKKFAFDIELLLKSELIKTHNIEKVPIAWIDSEEASTTTDLQPYLPMLKSIAKMYRKYVSRNDIGDEFAQFVDELDDNSFKILLENIPGDIINREPIEFSEFDGVRVSDLKG